MEGAVATILCYGDSNTWGSDPASGRRFAPDVRWPGVLAATLGEDYRIIEEGHSGRTTVRDDLIETNRNGRTYLTPCLESHQPLDLVIVMLGTNDLKARFGVSASDIAQGAGELGQMVRRIARTEDDRPTPVLLVAPPPTVTLSGYDQMFAGADEKSRQFAHYYTLAAEWYRCAFFDAGSVAVTSPIDGIHLEAPEHRKLGEALAAEVRRLVGSSLSAR